MPAAEVEVTEELVAELLVAQHPDLADLPLRLVAFGWDNAIFRLGDHLCVRLPRRELAAELVRHEQRWLPHLAPTLPLPIPAPLRVGAAADGFPWAWSVCPWFDGDVAADAPLASPHREARRLGEFAAALHRPGPTGVPHNAFFRGAPIDVLTPRVEENLVALQFGRADEVRRRWRDLVDAAPWSGPPLWIHGDLHTANLLVDGGAISAVIDFGDITAADPAVDLAIAWMLFDPAERAVFREAASGGPYPVDDDMWCRAEAWALHFGVIYLLNSADNPRFTRMGTQLLENVLDRP